MARWSSGSSSQSCRGLEAADRRNPARRGLRDTHCCVQPPSAPPRSGSGRCKHGSPTSPLHQGGASHVSHDAVIPSRDVGGRRAEHERSSLLGPLSESDESDVPGVRYPPRVNRTIEIRMARGSVVERSQLIDQLIRLPVEELVDVLREVFAVRQPSPEESEFCRNRFFVGVATSFLEPDESDLPQWEPWETQAIAYPDPAQHGSSLGPDYGLCHWGTCQSCGFAIRSNVKYGRCSICGEAVYMT